MYVFSQDNLDKFNSRVTVFICVLFFLLYFGLKLILSIFVLDSSFALTNWRSFFRLRDDSETD